VASEFQLHFTVNVTTLLATPMEPPGDQSQATDYPRFGQEFLRNEWDKRQTVKCGGRRQIILLDEAAAEAGYIFAVISA